MQPKEPVMRPGSLRRQLTMLFVFLIGAQLVVVALLYSRIKHFAKQHTELLQIDELRTELYALRAAALDAETGQRGFVITGREEFLQPYRASVPSFQPRLARLRLLVAPPQKTRVEALATQLALAQSDMARLVELRRLDGFEAAQQKMLDGTQREAMDPAARDDTRDRRRGAAPGAGPAAQLPACPLGAGEPGVFWSVRRSFDYARPRSIPCWRGCAP